MMNLVIIISPVSYFYISGIVILFCDYSNVIIQSRSDFILLNNDCSFECSPIGLINKNYVYG